VGSRAATALSTAGLLPGRCRAYAGSPARRVGSAGAVWADLVGIWWVTLQADASQRQVDRAKLDTAYGADRAIWLEFTAVGICIAHGLQIPAHRLTDQSCPLWCDASPTPFDEISSVVASPGGSGRAGVIASQSGTDRSTRAPVECGWV